MKVCTAEQGTEAWLKDRAGVPSASEFDKIIQIDGKRSKSRDKYLYRVAGEAILGKPEESYKNAAMERGQIMEEEARQAYQLITGASVQQVGFCVLDNNTAGCSPDGFVGNDGLLEIKCPGVSNHVYYLLKGEVPSDYFQQTQGQLFITGRGWLDFMSYFGTIRPLIVRIFPDPKFHEALSAELKAFNEDLKAVIDKIK